MIRKLPLVSCALGALLLTAGARARAAVQHAAAQAPRASEGAHALPFIEDDYAAALRKAKAARELLFVDAWATWCHSCLSMKRFVLSDPGLLPVRDAVVWLSIETEQEKNRAFVEKFPIDGLPTFFLVDPATEQVFARWLGSGSVNELRAFVQENAAAFAGQSGAVQTPAARATSEGDRARQRGDAPATAAAYRKAVQLSDAGDRARPERLVLLANALSRLGTLEAARECTQLGLANLERTGTSAVAADFATTVAGCAERVSGQSKGDAAVKTLRAGAEARLAALTADAKAQLSVDDRSDALASLAELQDADGRHADAVATMKKRAAVLEAGANAAPDATTASTFDPHRTDTYLFLGEPQKAEALLTEREQQMPEDYNPPARLARVLLEERKLAPAEAAVDRALSRMTQGPRRVGILALKAKILAAQKKPVAPVLREELEVLRALPATQRRPDAEKKVEAELSQEKGLAAQERHP